MIKKKLAFVDLTNFVDWPVGGMLQYELTILKYLNQYFDIDLWGVSVDGRKKEEIVIHNIKYQVNIWGNVKTKNKIIPNYWRGLSISKGNKNKFKDYNYVYVHTGSCAVGLNSMIDHDKTKLIYHQHGLSHKNDYSLMSLIQRPFVNYAQKISNLIFVVSSKEEVNEYVSTIMRKAKGKFLPILSPIILDQQYLMELEKNILTNRKKVKNFIYTGRLDLHKDVQTVIEAFDIYHKKFKGSTLTIVGDGDKRQSLENLCLDLKLNDCIKFIGAVPHEEVSKYLSMSDIYLTASIGEGMSIAVLEAYMSGLPVVCFNVPGLRKQVVNGKTGIVLDKRCPEEMCNGMIQASKNYRKLSLGCLNEVKKYDAVELTKYIAQSIMEDSCNEI